MTVKNFSDIAVISKDNVDALVKSGTAFFDGFKVLGAAYATLTKTSIDRASEAVKTLTTVKTVNELRDLSISLTKSNVELALVEGRKLQSLIKTVVEDSAAPLAARVKVATGLSKAA
ncbi:MAG TPA: phasin family protein [Rhodospirillaceae bacterium]|nr:phasin family protein [Rhodospirillaceae bacterium]